MVNKPVLKQTLSLNFVKKLFNQLNGDYFDRALVIMYPLKRKSLIFKGFSTNENGHIYNSFIHTGLTLSCSELVKNSA